MALLWRKRAIVQWSLQPSQPWLAAAFTRAAVFLVPVFAMMFWRCDSTVRGTMKSFSAIYAVVSPSTTNRGFPARVMRPLVSWGAELGGNGRQLFQHGQAQFRA